MVKRTGLIEIPKALFKDKEISTNRAEYIKGYLYDESKIVPYELINQYGLYTIPQSILVEWKRGKVTLGDLTFLFACYYIASSSKSKRVHMEDVFECITRNWDEHQTRNTEESLRWILANIHRYKKWIKMHEHNNKYYVKY